MMEISKVPPPRSYRITSYNVCYTKLLRAAALAFGMDKQGKGDRKVAVYDLGGGTFSYNFV